MSAFTFVGLSAVKAKPVAVWNPALSSAIPPDFPEDAVIEDARKKLIALRFRINSGMSNTDPDYDPLKALNSAWSKLNSFIALRKLRGPNWIIDKSSGFLSGISSIVKAVVSPVSTIAKPLTSIVKTAALPLTLVKDVASDPVRALGIVSPFGAISELTRKVAGNKVGDKVAMLNFQSALAIRDNNLRTKVLVGYGIAGAAALGGSALMGASTTAEGATGAAAAAEGGGAVVGGGSMMTEGAALVTGGTAATGTAAATTTASATGIIATVKKVADSKIGATILSTAKKLIASKMSGGGEVSAAAAPQASTQEGFFLHFLRVLLA